MTDDELEFYLSLVGDPDLDPEANMERVRNVADSTAFGLVHLAGYPPVRLSVNPVTGSLMVTLYYQGEER